MWPYKQVSQEEFNRRKKLVEQMLIAFGAKKIDLQMTYKDTSKTILKGVHYTSLNETTVYMIKERYVRVDEILFPDKPYIVLEVSDNVNDVLESTMEDCDPFPYDLSDAEIQTIIKKQFV